MARLFVQEGGRRILTRNQRLKCTCAGYWFPHRRGGGACEESPTRDIHLAMRYDDPEVLLNAVAEYAWSVAGKVAAQCPF